MDDATYLGDGVYAAFDGYQIRLSASNNIVYLDPYVLTELLQFVESLKDKLKEEINGK